jgi:type IV secretory pathway VirD2 relaxase
MIKREKRKSNRKEYKAENEQNYFVCTHVHTKHLHIHVCVCTNLL